MGEGNKERERGVIESRVISCYFPFFFFLYFLCNFDFIVIFLLVSFSFSFFFIPIFCGL